MVRFIEQILLAKSRRFDRGGSWYPSKVAVHKRLHQIHAFVTWTVNTTLITFGGNNTLAAKGRLVWTHGVCAVPAPCSRHGKNRMASKPNTGWLTNFCGSTVLPCQKCCATWTGMQCGNAVTAANWRWHVANAGITATKNHVRWILALWIQHCLQQSLNTPCLLDAFLEPVLYAVSFKCRNFLQNLSLQTTEEWYNYMLWKG